MRDESLLVSIDKRGVAHLTLNRPKLHNAFDAGLIAAMTTAAKKLMDDTSVRLVVLAGEGKSFCAGGDLNWMRSMKDFSREENVKDSQQLADMFAALYALPMPVLGVVHGFALGGGSGLAAMCDFVLAADDATFGFTETRIGILPAVISPYVIEKIGLSFARAYFTSGMRFDAHAALNMGLAHRVVAPDNVPAARETLVAEFLKAAPNAARAAKRMMHKLQQFSTPPQAAELTVQAIADARTSPEGQEGMAALLEGRAPNWSTQ